MFSWLLRLRRWLRSTARAVVVRVLLGLLDLPELQARLDQLVQQAARDLQAHRDQQVRQAQQERQAHQAQLALRVEQARQGRQGQTAYRA